MGMEGRRGESPTRDKETKLCQGVALRWPTRGGQIVAVSLAFAPSCRDEAQGCVHDQTARGPTAVAAGAAPRRPSSPRRSLSRGRGPRSSPRSMRRLLIVAGRSRRPALGAAPWPATPPPSRPHRAGRRGRTSGLRQRPIGGPGPERRDGQQSQGADPRRGRLWRGRRPAGSDPQSPRSARPAPRPTTVG